MNKKDAYEAWVISVISAERQMEQEQRTKKLTKKHIEKATTAWTDDYYFEKDELGSWRRYRNSMRSYELTDGLEVTEAEVYKTVKDGYKKHNECGLVIDGEKYIFA